MTYEKTSTDGTAAVHHRNEWVCIRLCKRENLPRQLKICLYSGIELLFLPRSCGLLPNRGVAGAVESKRFSCSFRCLGRLLRVREPAGTLRLRLAVSLWAGTGSLHKIPIFKKKKRLPYHHILKYGKYAVLIFLCVSVPCFCLGDLRNSPRSVNICVPPAPCSVQSLCSVQMRPWRGQAGGLFLWKLGILIAVVLLSIKIYRPFCQYLCPLGAIYGWFNRFSLVQIQWEKELCVSCMACEKACPVSLSLQEISRSSECIRCGKCVDACPQKCLHFFGTRTKSTKS